MRAFHRHEPRRAILGAFVFGALFCVGQANAQQAIGGAKIIENQVNGQLIKHDAARMHVGDQVFQDENVSTAAASLAQLVLRDDTDVSLGPSSQIRLDQFVYNGSGNTAKKVVFDATKGAFRFFSGNSAHDAYQVTTPQAVIGVRGTIYDVRLEKRGTRIVLQEGALHACLARRTMTKICKDLNEVGWSLFVGPTSIEGPIPPAQKTWDFNNLCGGRNASAACIRTTVGGIDLSPAKTRTQLASLPRPVRQGRAPTLVGKKRPPRRQAQLPPDDGDGGTYAAPVAGPVPVVPLLPFAGGFGFRGGFGGRGGGDFGGDRGGGGLRGR
ncbi:MAG TPA: FecR domain-containing protein [Beijerinckiaceae bacterium]|nr:FecR domain-containing protein [Beijerinckiaceae bacterium]